MGARISATYDRHVIRHVRATVEMPTYAARLGGGRFYGR